MGKTRSHSDLIPKSESARSDRIFVKGINIFSDTSAVAMEPDTILL
jgi:hypothetical protein